ncbi:uncharacterized protein LOC144142392 [Haemaphysalis longicornis]
MTCNREPSSTAMSGSRQPQAAVCTADKAVHCGCPGSTQEATQTDPTSLTSAGCQTEAASPDTKVALVEDGVTSERCRRLCHAVKPPERPQETLFTRSPDQVHQQTHAEEEPHARQSPAQCSTTRPPPETGPVIVSAQPAANEPPHECSLCKRHFSTKRSLLAHEKTHTQRRYPCHFCWRRFADQTSCSNHERMHAKRAAHVCPVCKRGFSRQDHLVAHTAQCFKCQLCNKRFRCHADVVAHEAAHDERFECDVCKRRFRRHADMRNHAASHARARAFACDVCKRRFCRQADMDNHAKSHKKAFTCEVCGGHFLCKQSLIDHMITHVEKKPYACILCHQVFLEKAGLVRHECVPLRRRMAAAAALENSFPE